ncbi:MAG TPA: class I SAM-dependent methyltransferase [Phycisphaerae bacterium]|nr:class I SAM-dependent methyltransferase [Phycisphaerae bacterium]
MLTCRMKETLERIVPEAADQRHIAGDDTLQLHLSRYEFASQFARGKVLDIACGVGYGSALLAALPEVREVTGVDLAEEALELARERYARPNIRFVQGDCMTYTGEAVNTIVSLETVEHLPEPEKFIRRIAEQLSPGGVLIASVPVTPSMDFNPYHLHDFTPGRFEALMRSAGLEVVDRLLQIQAYRPVAALRRKEARMADARRSLSAFYLGHPSKFFLRAWSVLRDGFANKYLTLACRKV